MTYLLPTWLVFLMGPLAWGQPRPATPLSPERILASDEFDPKLQGLPWDNTESYPWSIHQGNEEHTAAIMLPMSPGENGSVPLLVYVYGAPAAQTVTNRWGGTSDRWHRYLVDSRHRGGQLALLWDRAVDHPFDCVRQDF